MSMLSKSAFQNAQQIIDDLYKVVVEQEATYASKGKQGVGTAYIEALKQTKVSLGNPNDEIVRLSVQEAAIHSNEFLKKKFQGKKIYYLSLSVSLRSGNGTQFSRVWCEFDFSQKKGQDVIIQQVFPTPEWKTVITYGASLKLALDSMLKWVVGLPGSVNAQQLQQTLNNEMKANLVNEDNMSAFVQVHPYSFEMGRADIAATGPGSNVAFWDISKPDLHKAQTAKFIVIFTVPKEVKKIKLVASVAAEPDFPVLVANLRDVWEFLDKKFQILLKKLDGQRTPEEKLPIGDQNEWEIDLP